MTRRELIERLIQLPEEELDASMVLYVVTDGDYSDYHIEGVFSTAEEARDYVSQFAYPPSVEEWTLDELAGAVMGPVYSVQIDLVTGEIRRQHEERKVRRPDGPCIVHGPWYERGVPRLLRVESPVSTDHALKVAVERRQQWLRERSPTSVDANAPDQLS